VSVAAGKTEDARDFMRELEDKREPDYDRSERRIGVTKQVWYLAHTPVGDQFVAYVEAEDFAGPCPCSPDHKRSSTCGSSAPLSIQPALI